MNLIKDRVDKRISASDFLLYDKRVSVGINLEEEKGQIPNEISDNKRENGGTSSNIYNSKGSMGLEKIDEFPRESSDSEKTPNERKIKDYPSYKNSPKDENLLLDTSKEKVNVIDQDRRSSQTSSISEQMEKNSDRKSLSNAPTNSGGSPNYDSNILSSISKNSDGSPVSEIDSLIKQAEKARKACQFNKALDLYEESLRIKWQVEKTDEDQQTSDILYGLG